MDVEKSILNLENSSCSDVYKFNINNIVDKPHGCLNLGESLERIIKTQMVLIVFGDEQFCFRQGGISIQALSKFVGHVLLDLEEGNRVSLTTCDLSKTFDCIFLDLLKQMLFGYGFGETS